ncbi:MAG: HYR domain-containing protein, partial [Pseudomonadales bacterium]|nr:HYR domain-containing protein [Pseudomonadales bacterium]
VELPDQACEAFVSWIPAEATDNCGVQNLISNHASGSAFPVGGTTVLYTATDLSGNESYGMFQVTVLDTTSPIIGGLPQPIITQTDQGQCGASVMWVEPTVFDNCTVVTFESSHLPGSIIPVGTTTVSYTASDAGGNTTTASFSITVSDSENPVVVPSGAITVDADPGSCTAFVAVPPPASTDNCSVASLVNDFNGTSEASGIFPMDTTVILWIVTDSYGNVGTAAQAITVSVPQIDCNLNGSPDTCDIASGTSLDCNVDGIPDECQEDCNGNGVPDDCDIAAGALPDCNGNGIPDSCDITSGMAQDCDLSGVPDTCEVTSGQLPDCNANGTPDTCEIGSGVASDCNGNGIPDACDLSSGTSTDCNL